MVLQASGVEVALGARPVLRGASLRLHRGELVALLGANGSGKSTLVRAALGLVPVQGGRIELFGQPLARFRDWHRVGWVPQRSGYGQGVPATVREVVESGRLRRGSVLRRFGAHDRAGVEEAIGTVGLAERAGDSVAELSGGQQQRVLIARALAAGPELLLLDEPTAGVDAVSQAALAATLAQLAAGGTSVLLVAHELGALAELVDVAVVVSDGRIIPAVSAAATGADAHHGCTPVRAGRPAGMSGFG